MYLSYSRFQENSSIYRWDKGRRNQPRVLLRGEFVERKRKKRVCDQHLSLSQLLIVGKYGMRDTYPNTPLLLIMHRFSLEVDGLFFSSFKTLNVLYCHTRVRRRKPRTCNDVKTPSSTNSCNPFGAANRCLPDKVREGRRMGLASKLPFDAELGAQS